MTTTPLDLFRHSSDALALKSGDTLFREGERGECMYVVIDGEIDILVGDVLVDTAGPGSVVGEMALIDDKPRVATTVARSDCHLEPVDRRRFEFLIQQTPFFATYVMRILAERLRNMDRRLLGH